MIQQSARLSYHVWVCPRLANAFVYGLPQNSKLSRTRSPISHLQQRPSMPRGYLKHNKDVSRNRERGGASHTTRHPPVPDRRRQRKQANKSCIDNNDFYAVSRDSDCSDVRSPAKLKLGNCPICFEAAPVVVLSKKCWHEPACYACLRKVLVTNAQKDVRNYPLTCFHPQCQKPVVVEQLQKHGLLHTSEEVKKHHELTVLAKKRKNSFLTIRCPYPDCDHPRLLPKKFLSSNFERYFGCRACHNFYTVSPFYATLHALERIERDNDGWARCPSCYMVISKGWGCDHMTCGACDYSFDWERALSRPPLARPPDDEIYQWW